MQTFSTEETGQQKFIDDINKKRNQSNSLFGLGLVSLIAACGDAATSAGIGDGTSPTGGGPTSPTGEEGEGEGEGGEGEGEGGEGEGEGEGGEGEGGEGEGEGGEGEGEVPTGENGNVKPTSLFVHTGPLTPVVHEESLAFAQDQNEAGHSVTPPMITSVSDTHNRLNVQVSIDGKNIGHSFTFRGSTEDNSRTYLYQLTSDQKYNLVISSTGYGSLDRKQTGSIIIEWDAEQVGVKTLNINGTSAGDQIGKEGTFYFQKLGGDSGSYDIVIRAPLANYSNGIHRRDNASDNVGDVHDIGAVYILWDIAKYNHKSGLHGSLTAVVGVNSRHDNKAFIPQHGSLSIYGAQAQDQIGTDNIAFMQIGGAPASYDLILGEHKVDKPIGNNQKVDNSGAVYILWDVADYSAKHKIIKLPDGTARLTGATKGLLTVYGAEENDQIGSAAPYFYKINNGDSLDMVISNDSASRNDKGAVYILWDVSDYAGDIVAIDLKSPAATNGSLSIYGAKANDQIGNQDPLFYKIDGNNNYDMVLNAHLVDGNAANEGAIYIFWNVASYAGTNKTIDLGNLTSSNTAADYGLLTIYGKPGDKLGEDDKQIIHNSDGSFIDIDNDNIRDIVFKDKEHTYILFGDKVASTVGVAGNKKVESKTVDLATINTFTDKDGANANSDEGFFEYNFGGGSENVVKVGYRFNNDDHADLTAVNNAFLPNAGLSSDSDAGVAYWDIG